MRLGRGWELHIAVVNEFFLFVYLISGYLKLQTKQFLLREGFVFSNCLYKDFAEPILTYKRVLSQIMSEC